ncbi:hypothetical protein LSAT2_017200 [Lamellibrachia satsuma]|nr:hypothetical protein LSAT2_017200 [Lamellibrachia satsuma]
MSAPPYIMIAYIGVPILVLLLVAILIYVCCAKRYRLNWYEQTLLESTQAREKEHIDPHDSRMLKHVYTDQDLGRKLPVSTCVGRVHSTGNLDISSQPTEGSGETDGDCVTSTEQFWVPEDILIKKRAQSLIPKLLYTEGKCIC